MHELHHVVDTDKEDLEKAEEIDTGIRKSVDKLIALTKEILELQELDPHVTKEDLLTRIGLIFNRKVRDPYTGDLRTETPNSFVKDTFKLKKDKNKKQEAESNDELRTILDGYSKEIKRVRLEQERPQSLESVEQIKQFVNLKFREKEEQVAVLVHAAEDKMSEIARQLSPFLEIKAQLQLIEDYVERLNSENLVHPDKEKETNPDAVSDLTRDLLGFTRSKAGFDPNADFSDTVFRMVFADRFDNIDQRIRILAAKRLLIRKVSTEKLDSLKEESRRMLEQLLFSFFYSPENIDILKDTTEYKLVLAKLNKQKDRAEELGDSLPNDIEYVYDQTQEPNDDEGNKRVKPLNRLTTELKTKGYKPIKVGSSIYINIDGRDWHFADSEDDINVVLTDPEIIFLRLIRSSATLEAAKAAAKNLAT